MIEETWKSITNFPNYDISNYGNVKNNKTGKILKKTKNIAGYNTVQLYKNKKSKSFTTHKLVCFAFGINYSGGNIKHINNDKSDDFIENLEYSKFSQQLDEIWTRCFIDKNTSCNDYIVSNYGNIKNIKTNQILSPTINNCGYQQIYLGIQNSKKTYLLHRIVLFSFKSDTYFKDAVVDHLDNNKINNQLYNLEWVAHHENSTRASKKGLYCNGIKNYKSILTDHQIPKIKKLYNDGKSQRAIGKLFKVSQSTIYNIVNNKTWRHVKEI